VRALPDVRLDTSHKRRNDRLQCALCLSLLTILPVHLCSSLSPLFGEVCRRQAEPNQVSPNQSHIGYREPIPLVLGLRSQLRALLLRNHQKRMLQVRILVDHLNGNLGRAFGSL
jgi:hypothetical protein